MDFLDESVGQLHFVADAYESEITLGAGFDLNYLLFAFAFVSRAQLIDQLLIARLVSNLFGKVLEAYPQLFLDDTS